MNKTDPEPGPRFVTARDGTALAYWTTGSGPPLLLVHGAMSDHRRWRIQPWLEPHRSVHLMDRRGRGMSGDGPEWSLDREVDDVVAVVEALGSDAGAPVDLLGHSLGGALSLRAAARTQALRTLVLYEPAINEQPAPPQVVKRMRDLLRDGRNEDVTRLMMREVVLMPEAEIEALTALPSWPTRVAAAPTLPREISNLMSWDGAEGKDVTVPTLVIQGGDSPDFVQEGARLVAGSIPGASLTVLEGQQHVADQIVPDVFARVVLDFLLREA